MLTNVGSPNLVKGLLKSWRSFGRHSGVGHFVRSTNKVCTFHAALFLHLHLMLSVAGVIDFNGEESRVQVSAKRNFSTFQNLVVFGIGVFAALAVTSESSAGTLSVCQNGCDYSLPSQALGAASDGDTINIGPGTC